jgi:hypothetical protein
MLGQFSGTSVSAFVSVDLFDVSTDAARTQFWD